MEDWRLNGQETYLYKAKITRKKFKSCGFYDHAHCDFCWDKISESEDDLQIGYCTADESHWICETCYNDFKKLFLWEIEEQFCESINASKTITELQVGQSTIKLKISSRIIYGSGEIIIMEDERVVERLALGKDIERSYEVTQKSLFLVKIICEDAKVDITVKRTITPKD